MTDPTGSRFPACPGRHAVEVVPLDAGREEAWNDFVTASNNGTEFHRTDFLRYHPPGRYSFRHLLFLDGGRLVSVLPGAVDGDTYRSPAGASMGGFVLRRGAGLDLVDEIVRAFVAWCAGEGIREAFIGQPMPIYSREPDDSGEYALLRNGFTPVDPRYSSVADLRLTGSRSAMPCKTRHNIVRSETYGVRIVDSDDFAVFHAILTENKRKFGCAPTHTLEELERIRELRPAMIRLFLAELEGRPVAGLMLFLVNPVCALDFYTAQDYRYHHCNPVSLLVEHAMTWCRDRGYRHFDYGVSMDTSSRNPLEVTRSLVRFKESLGCTGSIRRTYRRTIRRQPRFVRSSLL